MKSVTLVMGYPAAGKSSIAELKEANENCVILNRDKAGGKVIDLLPKFSAKIKAGAKVLLDNTFPTAESRKPFIDVADLLGVKIHCFWLKTSIEDAQLNACLRMVRKHGKILTPEEIKQAKDPNMYPPAPLFKYRKQLEPPKLAEGFESINEIPFVRTWGPEYKSGAYIFDYDGTLRESKGTEHWPLKPSEVVILPGRRYLKDLKAGDATLHHARLLGASNQSAIAKGNLSTEDARACFEKTNKLLGVDIDYEFCPHRVPPISCWCRKPMPGISAYFIEKYKLDPSKCLVVGDMTTDQTFAKRSGMGFEWAKDFFK